MKNVTPAAGHVWNNRNHSDQVTVRSNIDGQIQYNRGICVFEMPYGQFIKSFEFVPQSDLERPTVGVPNIDMRSKHDFVISSDDRMMKEFESSPLLNDKLTDLQVYRFVSDKPKRSIYLGLTPLNYAGSLVEPRVKITTEYGDAAKAFRELGKVIDNLNKQKETTMIDLSECNVNDEFLTGRGLVMTVVYIGFNSIVMKDKDCNLNVYDMDTGSVLTFKIGPQYDIASKHKSVTSGEKFRVLCEMFPLLVREMAKTSGYSIDQLRELIVDGKYIINDKCELSLAL